MFGKGKTAKTPLIVNINRIVIFFAAVFFVSLLILTGVGIYYTYSYFDANIAYRKVKAENRQLVSTLNSLKELVENKVETVDEISRLETDLSIHYGISPTAEEIKKMSVGGRTSLSSRAEMMLGSPLEKSITIVEEDIYSYKRRADFLKTRLESIREEAERQNSYFSEKPSIYPVMGRVTSEFGNRFHPVFDGYLMHQGIDIANSMWMPVKASADGIVTFSGIRGSYGILVVIEHKRSGYTTRYAHLAETKVNIGDRVKRGDIIGSLGNTGISTGPHLHYEVRNNERAYNPRHYFINPEPNIIID